MDNNNLKIRVQRNVLLGSVLIMAGKFIAYFITMSVGIFTDALESIVNVAAGSLSLYCLYRAAQPRDWDHPYGHGKMELLSASAEGAMIAIAGLLIIYKGVERLLHPVEIEQLDLGIIIVAVSGIANFLMGAYSIRVGKKHDSMALVAEGKHLQSDTYSSIGLVAGLLLLYFTGIAWIDSAVGIIFGAIIIATGINIIRKTVANLTDAADQGLLEKIADTLNNCSKDEWINFHNVKLLKYGSLLHIDCDVILPWYYTVEKAHQTGDELKALLAEKLQENVELTIHFDPCNIFNHDICSCCTMECKQRKQPFTQKQALDFKNISKAGAEVL